VQPVCVATNASTAYDMRIFMHTGMRENREKSLKRPEWVVTSRRE
jgi:hypothetical protein